jgi:two-component system, sensor histidine kinase
LPTLANGDPGFMLFRVPLMSAPVSLASTPVAPSLVPPAKPAVRTPDHPIEIRTRVELVRIAFSELTHATWVGMGFSVALAAAVAVTTPALIAAGVWLAGMFAVFAYRLWLVARFRRSEPAAAESPAWALRFVTATTLNAAGWGATAWVFPTLTTNSPLQLVHVLILAGLAITAARLMLPMRKGGQAYIFALTLPVAARFFVDGDAIGIGQGLSMLVFCVYLSQAFRRSHRALSDTLALRFERETLAAELTEENARREIRESELREARERAESASRAKGEFLATISHEIRTPMNGVLGMLRIVRDTQLSSEQRSYLKTASDSAEALLLLLNDVLDFSKIEAGRLELEHAPFPPSTAARAVADLMVARARDKSLQFDLQLADNLPGAIIGDATRVRQILVNLIGNAIKFTERGRVELSVVCAERTAARATMQFTVTDSGIGMDSAALDKLFKPFTQADTSMSRRYGGTGLGLAISMRLAQAMGGAIQVSSTLNQGSTFRLILPCKLPEISTPAPRTTEAPRFVTPSLIGRVLVVEDDSVNKQVIELFLKKMNVTPSFAPDGEAAIATATTEPFDVVLMDCQLPGIDGLEATRQIRQKIGPSPMKIIALTANASTHVREACLAAGMDDFLSKPVRFELLAGMLERHLPAAKPATTIAN